MFCLIRPQSGTLPWYVTFEYRDGLLGEPDRVEHVVVQDGLEQVVFVVGLEGGLPRQHLVQEHAQRPPVHGRTVLQLLQDLEPYTITKHSVLYIIAQ